MSLRSVGELKNIRGKRVLLRVDFNVHIDERGRVGDDTKIAAAVPTIELLLKKGTKVILMTHLGRPAAKSEMGAIVKRLSDLLKKRIQTSEKWNFEKIGESMKKLKLGEVLMLPNLRLHPGEEKNSALFARELSELADFYVNEAFSVSHRAHASVVGVAKLLPAYAGLRLIEEIRVLNGVLETPTHPFTVLMGGGKITDKIGMMRVMAKRADTVLAGGALATHFLKAAGYGVGASKIESKGVALAKKLLGNKKIILPRDVVVGTEDGRKAWVVEIKNAEFKMQNEKLSAICAKPYEILDIGPKTILEFAGYIKRAKTLAWNGPVGRYEVKRFSHGTLALGRLFAARSRGTAFGVIGGGETIDAVRKTGMAQYVDFISTGGGAMLAFLGGEKLPGIEALNS